MYAFILAKPIRAGQGHIVSGIRGGGGQGNVIVAPKIISDESLKRKSLKGELCYYCKTF